MGLRPACGETVRARDDPHFRTADPKRFGEQPHHRLVRGTVRGRFGYPDLKLLAAAGSGPPAADPRLGRARRDAIGEDGASIHDRTTSARPTLLPLFMKNSSGSTAKVTIIISLKSSR